MWCACKGGAQNAEAGSGQDAARLSQVTLVWPDCHGSPLPDCHGSPLWGQIVTGHPCEATQSWVTCVGRITHPERHTGDTAPHVANEYAQLPLQVIDHFFDDCARNGTYTGFPWLGASLQSTESPHLRALAGMPAGQKGVLIRQVLPRSLASGAGTTRECKGATGDWGGNRAGQVLLCTPAPVPCAAS